MAAIFQKMGEFLVNVLPLSPFQGFIDSIGSFDYLGWLNWFFPVGDCLIVLSAWVTVIGAFFLYSIVMRWLKVIGD